MESLRPTEPTRTGARRLLSRLSAGGAGFDRPARWRLTALAVVAAVLVATVVTGIFVLRDEPSPESGTEGLADPPATFLGHPWSAMSVAFSPDGSLIATSGLDGTVGVWDTTTGENLTTLSGHEENLFSVAFSPDGGILATGGDHTARLWDADTGESLTALNGHVDWVSTVAFSPDGGVLATASGDGTTRLWDTDTGEHLTILRHEDWMHSVAFSPDGSLIATTSTDAFDPDGSVASPQTGFVHLWDADTGESLLTIENEHDFGPVAFSPDGGVFAAGDSDATIRLWDTDTGENLATLNEIENDEEDEEGVYRYRYVQSIAFSPDGTLLATGRDASIRLWDIDTGESLTTLTGHEAQVNSVAFSPDGTLLATASGDGTTRLWNIDRIGRRTP